MIRKIAALSVLGACLFVSACGQKPQAEFIFPDKPFPDPFNRAYNLTQSKDGNVRVFAKETRDDTDLFEMRKQADGSWSEPKKLEFPKRHFNTNPHFSPYDGRMYFATDRAMPNLEFNNDNNIWSVELKDDGWGEPVPVAGDINTGAKETSVAMTADGTMYFTSKYPHPGSAGSQDIYKATFDKDAGEWKMSMLPKHVNSFLVEDHVAVTPDGQHIFFYSTKGPKFGMSDIVAVSRTDAEGMEGWTKPYNIGGLVNTRGIELGPEVSTDGKTFFFSREGKLMSLPMDVLLADMAKARNAAETDQVDAFIKSYSQD